MFTIVGKPGFNNKPVEFEVEFDDVEFLKETSPASLDDLILEAHTGLCKS